MIRPVVGPAPWKIGRTEITKRWFRAGDTRKNDIVRGQTNALTVKKTEVIAAAGRNTISGRCLMSHCDGGGAAVVAA